MDDFSALLLILPVYLSELISVLLPSSYNLRRNYNGTLLCTPKSKSKRTLGDRAFSSAAPALWNSLPFAIRNVDQSVEPFNKKLKTHLEFLPINSCNSFVHSCIYIYLFLEFYFSIYIYSYIIFIALLLLALFYCR